MKAIDWSPRDVALAMIREAAPRAIEALARGDFETASSIAIQVTNGIKCKGFDPDEEHALLGLMRREMQSGALAMLAERVATAAVRSAAS